MTTAGFDKRQTLRSILADPHGSAFEKYRRLTVGDAGLARFVYYEVLTSLLGPLPGALGLLLRRTFYRRLFRECGRNVIIGRNCTFRHPGRMRIGDDVVIDDNVLLDARGTGVEGLRIGDGAMINRNVSIQSKGGDILIGPVVSVGANCQLVSWSGITLGAGVAMAAGCYVSAGNYSLEDMGKPMPQRRPITAGPVVIEENVWLATHVTILDGVQIGAGSTVSAGSVVSHSLGSLVVAHGNPAKVVFKGR